MFFPNIRRNAGTQSQSGGVDLENTDNFDFEVKSGRQYSSVMVRQFINQVKEEGTTGNHKVVLVKPDREEPYAVMPFNTFLDLLTELYSKQP